MAYLSTSTGASLGSAIRIRHFLSGIGTALAAFGAASRWQREIEALQSLSDGALAQRGLKREDIVRHVIGASYHI